MSDLDVQAPTIASARPTLNAEMSALEKMRLRPVVLVTVYLVTTYALFLFGPYVWPLDDYWLVTTYVAASFAIIYFSFRSGTRAQPSGSSMTWTSPLIVIGACLSVALLYPASTIYTGRAPWEVLDALADQRDAYTALQYQIDLTNGERAPIAFARAMAYPFVFAVLPLGIVNWTKISWPIRAAVMVTVLSSICFSILRGTNREVFDIAIIGGSAFLVRSARQRLVARHDAVATIRKFWMNALGIMGAAAILFVTFTVRLEVRVEGVSNACIGGTEVCTNIGDSIFGALGNTVAFGFAAATSYLAQGYYGLALALPKDFQPTWGIGHSSALTSLYEQLTESPDSIWERTFIFRNGEDGWDGRYQWSSLLTWFANDISFAGALLILIPLGWIWGRSWMDAIIGGDDRATVAFCIFMQVLFYLPANNQLLQTFDGYSAFLFWLFVWLRNSRATRYVEPAA